MNKTKYDQLDRYKGYAQMNQRRYKLKNLMDAFCLNRIELIELRKQLHKFTHGGE